MSETWYRIADWSRDCEVETVIVESSTDKTVVMSGRRKRISSWECFHRTKRECLEWLVELRREKLSNAQNMLDAARERVSEREEDLEDAEVALAEALTADPSAPAADEVVT